MTTDQYMAAQLTRSANRLQSALEADAAKSTPDTLRELEAARKGQNKTAEKYGLKRDGDGAESR